MSIKKNVSLIFLTFLFSLSTLMAHEIENSPKEKLPEDFMQEEKKGSFHEEEFLFYDEATGRYIYRHELQEELRITKAKVHILAKITVEQHSQYTSYMAIRINPENGVIIDLIRLSEDRQTVERAYTANELEKGVILASKDGYDIIKLNVYNFSQSNGAEMTLTYLHNGMSSIYKEFEMTLEKDGDDWGLYNQETGKKIGRLHFLLNKFFGKVIGIKKIITRAELTRPKSEKIIPCL